MQSELTEQDQTNPCAEIQAQLAAYALGEADADIDLLEHLSLCEGCQEDLRAYVQVARMLPYDAPEAAPPPALRERILAAVAEQAAAPAPAAPARPAPAAPLVREQPAPRRSLFGRRPALAFGFGALALVALVVWNISLQSRAAAQAADLDEEHRSWQTMIVLLNDPTLHWYAVSGAQATGRFWAAPQRNDACLVAQGLPKLDSAHVYQVWLLHGQERADGGTFQAFNGNGWVLVHSDKPMSSYDAVGVTIEPQGGSADPTGAPVLRGALTTSEQPSSAERQGALSFFQAALTEK